MTSARLLAARRSSSARRCATPSTSRTSRSTGNREHTNYGDPEQTDDSMFSRAVISIEITRKHSLRILLTHLLGAFVGTLVAFFAMLLAARWACSI